MKKLILLLILLQLTICSFAFASGTIKGTVTDRKTGEPLVGATVSIHSKSTGYKISTGVGLDGSFVFRNIPAGSYEIDARYVAFDKEDKDIEVQDGVTTTVKLSLKTKETSLNEVTVSGHADRTSDNAAQSAERRSPQLLNAVSARTIEASPDITIANVTQRVSGVCIGNVHPYHV